LREQIEDWQKQIKELEAQNEKLNKLVDDIYNGTYSIKPLNHIISDINNMISNYRNPSIIGTTHTVEIGGKRYEVTINKEI